MATKLVASEDKNVMMKELRASQPAKGPGFHVPSDRQAAMVASYMGKLAQTSTVISNSRVSMGGPSTSFICFAGKPQ